MRAVYTITMGRMPPDKDDEPMALKVPETFHTDDKPRAKARPEPLAFFRLPGHHQETLRDIAQGEEESDVGLCCTYLVDSTSGEGSDYDEHALNALEAYAESTLTFQFLGDMFGHAVVKSWRENIRRARRAIARLRHRGDHRAANVLMVYYGHRDPLARQLHDLKPLYGLGSLARYTNAVEAKRRELVRALAADPQRRFTGDAGEVISLVRHRDRLAWADASVSSGDALRAALAPFAEPVIVPYPGESVRDCGQRREARSRRASEHAGAIHKFVVQLEVECAAMLSRAESRYHEAWLASKYDRVVMPHPRAKRAPAPLNVHELSDVLPDLEPDARVRGAGWSST